jgi:hypothetical protein
VQHRLSTPGRALPSRQLMAGHGIARRQRQIRAGRPQTGKMCVLPTTGHSPMTSPRGSLSQHLIGRRDQRTSRARHRAITTSSTA